MALVLSATNNRSFFINHTEVKTVINHNKSMGLVFTVHGEEQVEHLSRVGSRVNILGVTVTLNPFFNNIIAKLAFDAPQHIVINTSKVYYNVTRATGGKLLSRRAYNYLHKHSGMNRETIDRIVCKAAEVKTEDDGTVILEAGRLQFYMRTNVIHRVEINE
ncbi:hypothetical protein NVP1215B_007 [Vibrio phage 1.215.B._10N.222.54.F7]|nr:hypothetical protein NVP1215A_007 [Vibrio phage 1.215.A._10N.222.54.F7]AUR96030.1 hypothetical protein NVP1215B_007 [Vibrio phage 1.215.B._10N.222.54.F7]